MKFNWSSSAFIILLAFPLASTSQALVFPNRTEIPLHFLQHADLSASAVHCLENETPVKGMGQHFCLTTETFQRDQLWGASVLKARVADGSHAEGTAVRVGEDIVLTTRTVANPAPFSTTHGECRSFQVKNSRGAAHWSACQQILFCSDTDFCFVQMQDAMALGSVPKFNFEAPAALQSATLMGNALASGLQAGRGKLGTQMSLPENKIQHHLPTESGTAGSPLFNDEGQVFAIHEGHEEDGAGSFNLAISMQQILKELLEAEKASSDSVQLARIEKILKVFHP